MKLEESSYSIYPPKGNTGQDLSLIFQAGDERLLDNHSS